VPKVAAQRCAFVIERRNDVQQVTPKLDLGPGNRRRGNALDDVLV